MPNRGPRYGEGCKVDAILKGVEDHTVRIGGVEAVKPHAFDLRGQLWEVVEVSYSLLQGSKGVTVDRSACGAINELIQGVA